jgi:hypothetical protein
LIATIGLPGRASTRVYKIVRELMIAGLGADRVVARFPDVAAGLTAHPEAAGSAHDVRA